MKEREEILYQRLKNRLDWWSRLRLNYKDDLEFIDSKIEEIASSLKCGYGVVGTLYLGLLEELEKRNVQEHELVDAFEKIILDSNANNINDFFVMIQQIVDYNSFQDEKVLFSDYKEDLKQFFQELVKRDGDNPCKKVLDQM